MTLQCDYNGDPAVSDIAALRFKLDDTHEPFEFNDSELQYLLDQNASDTLCAAIEAAEILARRYSMKVDKTIGRVSIMASQRAKAWKNRAVELRCEKNRKGSYSIPAAARMDAASIRREPGNLCGIPDTSDPNRKTVFDFGDFDNRDY